MRSSRSPRGSGDRRTGTGAGEHGLEVGELVGVMFLDVRTIGVRDAFAAHVRRAAADRARVPQHCGRRQRERKEILGESARVQHARPSRRPSDSRAPDATALRPRSLRAGGRRRPPPDPRAAPARFRVALLEPLDHRRAVAQERAVGALDDRNLDESGLRRDPLDEFRPRDLVHAMGDALVGEVRLHLPAEIRDVVDVQRVGLEAAQSFIVVRSSRGPLGCPSDESRATRMPAACSRARERF